MKRFSAREFALLSLPVMIVAGAGWWAARRGAPQFSDGQPKLTFHIEKPSALQASQGVETVLVVDFKKPQNTDFSVWQRTVRLNIDTPQGVSTWRNDGKGSYKTEAFSLRDIQGTRYEVPMKQVPSSPFVLEFDGQIISAAHPLGNALPLRDSWKIEPSQIKKFNFVGARTPLVELQSVAITRVPPSYRLTCEFAFDLKGVTANKNTEVAQDFNGWPLQTSFNGLENTARTRIVKCLLDAPTLSPGKTPLVEITGASAPITVGRSPLQSSHSTLTPPKSGNN